MEPDENRRVPADDPVAVAARQDLDPLSVAELEARVAALEAEIARTRDRMARAGRTQASAEALFRR